MLKIRFSRFGKKKKPFYRITVSEKAKDTHGDALEYLGHYDPQTKVCEVKKDRILYWLSKGAKPSPTVHNLLIDQNVITGEKVRASKSKKRKKDQKEKIEPVAKLDDKKEEKPVAAVKEDEKSKEEKKEKKTEEKPKEAKKEVSKETKKVEKSKE